MTASRSSPVAMSTTCGSGASEPRARDPKSRPTTTTSSGPPVMIADTASVRSSVVLPEPPEPNTSHPDPASRSISAGNWSWRSGASTSPTATDLPGSALAGLGARIDEHVGERQAVGEHLAPRRGRGRQAEAPVGLADRPQDGVEMGAGCLRRSGEHLRRVVGAHERGDEDGRLDVVADERRAAVGRLEGDEGAGPEADPAATLQRHGDLGRLAAVDHGDRLALVEHAQTRCAGWCWRGCCRSPRPTGAAWRGSGGCRGCGRAGRCRRCRRRTRGPP